MSADGEHPLVTMARACVADHEAHQYVAQVAARVQARLDDALGCDDPVRARALLPQALRTLYVEVQPLIARSLLPGSIWVDQQHAACYRRAVALFGSDQRVVQRPPHEPMPPPRGWPGQIYPRY